MMMCNNNLFGTFDPYVLIFALMPMKWIFFLFIFLFKCWPIHMKPSGWSIFIYSTILIGWESFKSLMKEIDKSFITMMPLFFTILIINSTGLIPFVFTITSHLSVNLSISLSLWMSGVIFSMTKSISNFLSHMLPTGTPMILWMFLVLVESVSTIIRPITLSIRLMANIMAGHLIINLMSTFITLNSNWYFSISQSMFIMFELCVSIVQAYVFVSLLLLYWDESK